MKKNHVIALFFVVVILITSCQDKPGESGLDPEKILEETTARNAYNKTVIEKKNAFKDQLDEKTLIEYLDVIKDEIVVACVFIDDKESFELTLEKNRLVGHDTTSSVLRIGSNNLYWKVINIYEGWNIYLSKEEQKKEKNYKYYEYKIYNVSVPVLLAYCQLSSFANISAYANKISTGMIYYKDYRSFLQQQGFNDFTWISSPEEVEKAWSN